MIFDLFVNLLLTECDALDNGIAYISGFGASVGLYYQSVQSKQRRSSVLRSVKSFQCLFRAGLMSSAPILLRRVDISPSFTFRSRVSATPS